MKEIYNALLERLKTEVSALKMIDFDMGQLNVLDMDIRPSVEFPCCLIDISFPRCEDQGENIQFVEGIISLKLAFQTPLPTDSNASEARREAALQVFDTANSVYQSLQGYSVDEVFSALSRKSQKPDNRYAGIKIIDMVFNTTFLDDSAYQV